MEAKRLRLEMIPTVEITPLGKNYTVENEITYSKIKNNAIILGQIAPIHVIDNTANSILIDTNYIVIDGRIVLRVLKELGCRTVNCIVHTVSEERAFLMSCILNLSKHEHDFIKLSKLLNEVEHKPDIFNFLPYDEESIRELLKLIKFDWTKYKEETLNSNQITMFE